MFLLIQTSALRHGSAKKIFSLATSQIQSLYQSLLDLEPTTFHTLYDPLITSPRHIPLRIFLPPPHPPVTPLVAPMLSSTEHQTIGTALHQVLPALFPSRRTCLFARPVCQGVVVPMSARLDELGELFSGGDGWTDIIIVMMN
jgi:autophagy-related protein 5